MQSAPLSHTIDQEFLKVKKTFSIFALIALSFSSMLAFANDASRKVVGDAHVTYPALAKSVHVSGTVKVEVSIAANGHVRSAKALGGHPLLVDSAVSAVKSWHFEPASGETSQVVTVNFNLSE
jgi:TonB family protein